MLEDLAESRFVKQVLKHPEATLVRGLPFLMGLVPLAEPDFKCSGTSAHSHLQTVALGAGAEPRWGPGTLGTQQGGGHLGLGLRVGVSSLAYCSTGPR